MSAGRPLPEQNLSSMRIVHIITRLILGGAQENTLLTVEDQHRDWHDQVTLITGPGLGPEGSLIARAQIYGEKIAYSGPTLKRANMAGDKAVLTFDHAASGLVAKKLVAPEEALSKAVDKAVDRAVDRAAVRTATATARADREEAASRRRRRCRRSTPTSKPSTCRR